MYRVLLIEELYLFQFEGISGEGNQHASFQSTLDGRARRNGAEPRYIVQCLARGHILHKQSLQGMTNIL